MLAAGRSSSDARPLGCKGGKTTLQVLDIKHWLVVIMEASSHSKVQTRQDIARIVVRHSIFSDYDCVRVVYHRVEHGRGLWWTNTKVLKTETGLYLGSIHYMVVVSIYIYMAPTPISAELWSFLNHIRHQWWASGSSAAHASGRCTDNTAANRLLYWHFRGNVRFFSFPEGTRSTSTGSSIDGASSSVASPGGQTLN